MSCSAAAEIRNWATGLPTARPAVDTSSRSLADSGDEDGELVTAFDFGRVAAIQIVEAFRRECLKCGQLFALVHQKIPSSSRAASDIFSGDHGGDITSLTLALVTPRRLQGLDGASQHLRAGRAGRRGQRHLDVDLLSWVWIE